MQSLYQINENTEEYFAGSVCRSIVLSKLHTNSTLSAVGKGFQGIASTEWE